MAALEEVVLYAFQQCVYYLSKVCAATMLLMVAFPGPWDRKQGTSSFSREEATTGSTLALAVPLSSALPHTRSATKVQPCCHWSWRLLQLCKVTAMSSLFAPAAPVLASISPRGGSCWALLGWGLLGQSQHPCKWLLGFSLLAVPVCLPPGPLGMPSVSDRAQGELAFRPCSA